MAYYATYNTMPIEKKNNIIENANTEIDVILFRDHILYGLRNQFLRLLQWYSGDLCEEIL